MYYTRSGHFVKPLVQFFDTTLPGRAALSEKLLVIKYNRVIIPEAVNGIRNKVKKRVRTFSISGRKIGPEQPVFIIARVAAGRPADVKNLVNAAAKSGADAVYFEDPPPALVEHALKKNIIPLSFPRVGKDRHEASGIPAFVVPLKLARERGKGSPLIITANAMEIKKINAKPAVLKTLIKNMSAFMVRANSFHRANLDAIEKLSKKLRLPVGCSDHTPGVETALAATALGACILEKGIILENAKRKEAASLVPEKFKEMVQMVRNVSAGLGTGLKRPGVVEAEIMRVSRKSLVATRDLPKGAVLHPGDVTSKRPGTGIGADRIYEFTGRKLARAVRYDELFRPADFESI